MPFVTRHVRDPSSSITWYAIKGVKEKDKRGGHTLGAPLILLLEKWRRDTKVAIQVMIDIDCSFLLFWSSFLLQWIPNHVLWCNFCCLTSFGDYWSLVFHTHNTWSGRIHWKTLEMKRAESSTSLITLYEAVHTSIRTELVVSSFKRIIFYP